MPESGARSVSTTVTFEARAYTVRRGAGGCSSGLAGYDELEAREAKYHGIDSPNPDSNCGFAWKTIQFWRRQISSGKRTKFLPILSVVPVLPPLRNGLFQPRRAWCAPTLCGPGSYTFSVRNKQRGRGGCSEVTDLKNMYCRIDAKTKGFPKNQGGGGGDGGGGRGGSG